MSSRGILLLLPWLLTFGCAAPKDKIVTPVPVAPASTSATTVATAAPSAHPAPQASTIADDAPLREGLVSFEGMLRPTKGGLDVRGVVLDDAMVRDAMAHAVDGLPSDRDWFLGARVRVTARLSAHERTSARGPNGEVAQLREGKSFEATPPVTVELVKNAETIEGNLGRSKGFFELQGRLISSQDLEWSLVSKGGPRAGLRVRLRGQSRTYVCPPDAQCLTSGALPLFDVARAEVLP